MKFIKILSLLIFLIISISCSHKIVQIPPGNIQELNTYDNETAPIQKPSTAFTNCDICNKELKSKIQGINDGVKTSKSILSELIAEQVPNSAVDYIAKNTESVTFTSAQTGFVSISHPPDQNYAKEIGLPIVGIVGGTDIFEFAQENGKFIFRNMGEPINSEFWESHPYAVNDKNCNTLLVWASDRYDITDYTSYPYTNQGNSDLFYSFRINGQWTKVKNLSKVGDSINLVNSNEFSPFITCLCKAPILLFSSNRAGKDYDLYKVRLSIDFDKQIITSEGDVEKLDNEINSSADEYFPFIPNPISQQSYLYFSSNRFSEPTKISKDTLYKNIGLFDLYKFPFDTDCKARPKPVQSGKIKYNIVIKPADPDYFIAGPLFITTEINGPKQELKNGETIDLPSDAPIKTYGGSLYEDNINNQDGSLKYYQNRTISKLTPIITKRQIVQKYDTLVNPRYKEVFDTLDVASELVESSVTQLKSKNYNIKSVNFINPAFRIIWSQNKLYKQDVVSKKRIVIVYDTLQKYDTTYSRITRDNPALSVLTQKGFKVNYCYAEDVYVYDTIYIYPHYYHCPPCRWEYAQNIKADKKNVPFFQTGMWEVNTSENLKRQLKELTSSAFGNASFIELQPDNQEFGYLDPNFSQAQVNARRAKRNQRIEEYKVYADSVDKYLQRMADDITNKIIPAFTEELKIEPRNLLIIQVQGYSDIRPIFRGWYTGDRTVKYYSPNFDESTMRLTYSKSNKVEIFPMASMVGEANDTLSKLRAYSGYYELKKLLMKNEAFMDYVYKNQVYFPDEINIEEEIKLNINNAKMIFVIEGKQVDPTLIPKIPGYITRKDDFYELDRIRRIDVIINRVKYKNGKLESACCGE
jgi:hypothetical protein